MFMKIVISDLNLCTQFFFLIDLVINLYYKKPIVHCLEQRIIGETVLTMELDI